MPGGDHRGTQASDFETVGKRAHALKGASANIHAQRLSAAASSLESAARAKSCRRDRRPGAELTENLTPSTRNYARSAERAGAWLSIRVSRTRTQAGVQPCAAAAGHLEFRPLEQLRPASLLRIQALIRRPNQRFDA